jgi:MYXO-CTERM domain-containing protein
VDIELFSLGGWSPVFTQTADDGSELWTVPNIDADDCMIRISASGGNTPTDESDGPFSISPVAATCTNGATRPCYSGPAGTEGAGECRTGTETCLSGAWGACTDEVLPDQEDCADTLDNDCDGLTDAEDTDDCGGGPDGGQDAGPDGGHDAGPDVEADAGQDAGGDEGPGADADSGTDGAADGGGGDISGGCSCGSSTGAGTWLWWLTLAVIALNPLRRRSRNRTSIP